MLASNRIRLFTPRAEALHLGWPLFVTAVSILVVAARIGTMGVGIELERWLHVIAGVLFLNVIHNAFTFYLIFFLPEMREWMQAYSRGRPRALLVKWGLFYCGLLGLFCVVLASIGDLSMRSAAWLTAVLSLPSCFHHVRQQLGISLLYNREAERTFPLTEDQRSGMLVCERRERALFRVLTFGYMAGVGLALSQRPTRSLLLVISGALASVSLLLIWNSRRYPFAGMANKTTFLSRTLVMAAVPLSGLAGIAPSYIHGFEYAFLFGRLRGNSRAGRGTLVLLALCLAVFALFMFEPSRGLGKLTRVYFERHRFVINLLASASLATSFMHYYLDGVIFRMSNPDTRKALQSLLHPADA